MNDYSKWIVLIGLSACVLLFIAALPGNGKPAYRNFTCYEHDYTIMEIERGTPFNPACGFHNVTFLQNGNGSAFLIEYASNVDYNVSQMVPQIRYIYYCGNTTIYFYVDNDGKAFMVRLLECVSAYSSFDNKTVWCNATVEECETFYNRRNEV